MALANGAPLMLLNAPQVNPDGTLRNELREEFAQRFAAGNSNAIDATTEPGEARLPGAEPP